MSNAFLSGTLVLLIALGGGVASAWWMLRDPSTLGSAQAGGWTAFPDLGFTQADPYSKARVSRDGLLALGRAEGLSFMASRDKAGRALRRECSYQVDGVIPPARFWTLFAIDALSNQTSLNERGPAAIHSREILRLAQDGVRITVSRSVAPGNWLTISGNGPMALVLTLYDTSVANGADFSAIRMPEIVELACDA